MTTAPLIPAAEAAVFTLGCALIHTQRHHAGQLTEILAVVAAVVLIGLALMTAPTEGLNVAAVAIAMADMGDWLLMSPK